MPLVKEVMTAPVVTLAPDMPVQKATAILAEKNVSGAPVLDGEKIVGIFSEADVLRSLKTTKKNFRLVFPSISSIGIAFQEELIQRELLEAYEEIGSKSVSEVMSKEPHIIDAESTVKAAVMTMVMNNVNRLPVVSNDRLVGIITRGDVIRGLADDKSNAVEAIAP